MSEPEDSPRREPGALNPSSGVDMPAHHRSPWLAIATLPLLPIAFFALAASDSRWWGWLGLDHLRIYFADLIAILAAGEAQRVGLDVYLPNPFDPFGRPHVYGPWWLVSGHLGLRVSDARWLGPVLGAMFLVAAAVVLRPRTRLSWVAAAALIAAPPVLLALERANNDLVVFVLLAAIVALAARPTWVPHVLGSLLLVIAAALKVYPVAAIPVLLRRDRGRLDWLLAGAVSIACIVIGGIWRNEFHRALTLAPRPDTIFAYGLPVSALTWETLGAYRAWFMLGGLTGGVAFGVPLFRCFRAVFTAVPLGSRAGLGFVAGGLAWVTCYALTSNYPYRLTLLLLPAGLWIAQAAEEPANRIARLQVAAAIVLFWLTVPKRWLGVAAMVSDHRAAVAIWTLVGLEQVLALLLTASILTGCCGFVWRTIFRRDRPS